MSVTGTASFGFNLREFRWFVRKIVREREVVWVFPWRVPCFLLFHVCWCFCRCSGGTKDENCFAYVLGMS